ncbi:MAG: metalloregulator ArsR/SmtB family transcription factor [Casimicrobiaceae bacterium]
MESQTRRQTPPTERTEAAQAVSALAALAQETRLAIIRLLIEHAVDGLTPGAIASRLAVPPATLSFHLKELANAGLLIDCREGRFIWYRPDLSAMNGLMAYLTRNCCRASGGNACAPDCAPAACSPLPTRTRKQS